MSAKAALTLCVLVEDEIRSAAKLMARARAMEAAGASENDLSDAYGSAMAACTVALQGADDESAVLMLLNHHVVSARG